MPRSDTNLKTSRPFSRHGNLWNPELPFAQSPRGLRNLDIELSRRCNNRCIHCYINLSEDDHQARERELPTEAWKTVISDAVGMGVLEIRFTGGEPLLRKDFADLYLHARRCGLMVSVATNGRLLTPELGELFHTIPPLGSIEISVYGITAESYEKTSLVQDSFAEMMRGIAVLKAKRVPFTLNFSLLPATETELDRIAAWETSTAGRKRASRPVPIVNDLYHFRVCRDSQKKNRAIAGLRLSPDRVYSLLARDPRFPQDFLDYFPRLLHRPATARRSTPFICGLGCQGLIDPEGIFQPCLLLRHPRFQSPVWPHSSGHSIETARLRVLRRASVKSTVSSAFRETCGRCFFHGFCEQCPGQSWVEHGTLDTRVEYLCAVMHEFARRLGLLSPHENAWEVVDWERRLQSVAGGSRGLPT